MAKEKEKMVRKVCKQCGKRYFLPASSEAHGRNAYCSQECYDAAVAPFMNADDDALELLSKAILRTACFDYIELRKKRDDLDKEFTLEDREEMENLQDFFRNRMDIFTPGLDLEGDYFLKLLEDERVDRVLPLKVE